MQKDFSYVCITQSCSRHIVTNNNFRVTFAPLAAGNADIACLMLVTKGLALLVWDDNGGGEGDPSLDVHLWNLLQLGIRVLVLELASHLQASVFRPSKPVGHASARGPAGEDLLLAHGPIFPAETVY